MPESDESGASATRRVPLCPSSSPDAGAVVFAVRGAAAANGASMRYLDELVPVSEQILQAAAPVDPRQVFRFAAPCVESACVHFDGAACQLGQQIVESLEPVVADLPRCHLRARCRWFAERGGAACVRCPLVVTMRTHAEDAYVQAVQPKSVDNT
jgi:hypothetical protein